MQLTACLSCSLHASEALSAGQTPNYHSLSKVWVYESRVLILHHNFPAQFRFIANLAKMDMTLSF